MLLLSNSTWGFLCWSMSVADQGTASYNDRNICWYIPGF